MLLEEEGGWSVGGEATQPEHRPRRTVMSTLAARSGGTQTVSLAAWQRMNRRAPAGKLGWGQFWASWVHLSPNTRPGTLQRPDTAQMSS